MKDFGSLFSGKEKGVTFLELLVVIAIIGILAAIAVPNYGDYIERQRWIGASEAIYDVIQQAKRSSISNNKTVYFVANGVDGSSWCATYSEVSAAVSSADCNGGYVVSSANPSIRVQGSDYPGIVLDSSIAGANINAGYVMPGVGIVNPQTLTLTSSRLGDIDIEIGSAMKISICSDDLIQYPDC